MSTYFKARERFDENNNFINRELNPVEWNVSNGLSCLSSALENDLSRIHALLREILHELQRLK